MLKKKTISQCISSDYCMGWNDAVDEMPKWISVEEWLPKNLDDVLVFTDSRAVDIGFYNANGAYWHMYSLSDAEKVTHWLPLPSKAYG